MKNILSLGILLFAISVACCVSGQTILTFAGNGTVGFATPLATLHQFEGWADKFLTTPANGIKDLYGRLGWNGSKLLGLDSLSAAVVYHHFDAERFPREIGRVLCAHDRYVLAIDDQDVVLKAVGGRFLRGNLSVKATLSGIVFEEIREIIRRHDIADRDDLNLFSDETLFGNSAKDQPPNSTEPVNCNFNCHIFQFRISDFNFR